MSTPPSKVQQDIATLKAEYGFVRSNWGRLSAIIIIVFVLGFVLGHHFK